MHPEFFTDNRARLSRLCKAKLIIVCAHTTVQRVNDTSYPFEQDSDFYYLTGLLAPDWLLVMDTISGDEWLIEPNVPETTRVFDGSLLAEEASARSGVRRVLSKVEGKRLLEKLRDSHTTAGTVLDVRRKVGAAAPNPARSRLARRLKRLDFVLVDIRQDITTLRALKQTPERDAMRAAAAVTVDAFEQVKRALPKLSNECELQAEFDYAFKKVGSGHAYDPIVASGPRACTLHYTDNNHALPQNGLVVIDIGAKVAGYCADVTRTYAVGRPSERERAVHAAVERAHHEIIALLRPGLAVTKYISGVDAIMQRELKSLGLLNTPADYRRYFPHAISHGLGIDVHDSLGGPTHFKPGMVLTVEPGIYIPEEGIGVRIEDDILITNTGIENLTGALSTSL